MQRFARLGEAGDDGRDGDAEERGDIAVRQPLDRDQDEDLALLERKLAELRKHFSGAIGKWLRAAASSLNPPCGPGKACARQRHARSRCRFLRVDTAEQCEEVQAAIGLLGGFAHTPSKPKERLLDEAVGESGVAGQHTRISAKPGELGQKIGCVQRRRHACNAVRRYGLLIPPNDFENKMRYGNVHDPITDRGNADCRSKATLPSSAHSGTVIMIGA